MIFMFLNLVIACKLLVASIGHYANLGKAHAHGPDTAQAPLKETAANSL